VATADMGDARREALSMAVACVTFAWERDSEIGRAMRGDVVSQYEFTTDEWDRQATQVAEYAQRQGAMDEDVEQFLCVRFHPESGVPQDSPGSGGS
jgi:hypothetical protein